MNFAVASTLVQDATIVYLINKGDGINGDRVQNLQKTISEDFVSATHYLLINKNSDRVQIFRNNKRGSSFIR